MPEGPFIEPHPEEPAVTIHAWGEPGEAPLITQLGTHLDPMLQMIPVSVADELSDALTATPIAQRDVELPGPALPLHGRWYKIQLKGQTLRSIDVYGNLPKAELLEVAAYLLIAESMLSYNLGGTPTRSRLTVLMFSSFRDYCDYVQACWPGTSAEAVYFHRTRTVAFWIGHRPLSTKRHHVQQVLFHEMTHAYMNIVFKRNFDSWFSEGMAEYFANFSWEGGAAVPGVFNKSQFEVFQEGPRVNLSQILKLVGEEIYDPHRASLLYAASWYFTYFLWKFHPEVIHELLSGQLKVLDVLWKEFDESAELMARAVQTGLWEAAGPYM